MSDFQITYTGSSKVIKRLCELVNGKASLGETHDKAYYGDLGKDAYDHSQITSGNPHGITAEMLGLGGIASKVDAIMYAIGMIRSWQTHEAEQIVDHEGTTIAFHGANAENYNYLLYH